jgi:hypothetical protein
LTIVVISAVGSSILAASARYPVVAKIASFFPPSPAPEPEPEDSVELLAQPATRAAAEVAEIAAMKVRRVNVAGFMFLLDNTRCG